MNDFFTTWMNYMSFATASGNETVATHVSPSVVYNRGAGGTLAHKVAAGKALSGILERPFLDAEYEARVTTAFTSGGAGTLRLLLITDVLPTLVSAPVTLEDTGVLALASLTLGAKLWRGSLKGRTLKQYIGVQWIIGTAAMTAGGVWAGLTEDPLQLVPPGVVG